MSAEVLAVIGWLAGTVLNAAIANATKRDLNAVVAASLVASPVLVYLYLLATPPPRRTEPQAATTEHSGVRQPWVRGAGRPEH